MFGKSGGNGPSVARRRDSANAPPILFPPMPPAMETQLRRFHVHLSHPMQLIQVLNKCEIVHFVCLPIQIKTLPSGNSNTTTIDFFENAFTFSNESVTVNCCHSNNTIELATCGLGESCAGSCSALGASLCPSGDCSGNCEIPFEQETNTTGKRRGSSEATRPSHAFRWCSPGCNVWRHKGCCYNPVCKQKRESSCRWMNYLTGFFYKRIYLFLAVALLQVC